MGVILTTYDTWEPILQVEKESNSNVPGHRRSLGKLDENAGPATARDPARDPAWPVRPAKEKTRKKGKVKPGSLGWAGFFSRVHQCHLFAVKRKT